MLSSWSAVSIEATIQRAAEGDQAAWETIVRTYWRKVFNVAYRFVGTYDEAEDLTQEIFLKVFRSLGTFDRRANFQTWLISVSRNFCIDRYRSGRRDREVFAREVDASTVQAEAPGPNAYARVELQDRVALLREALRALSPPLRAAVLLRDIHELSYQEIADSARRGGRDGEIAHQPGPRRAGETNRSAASEKGSDRADPQDGLTFLEYKMTVTSEQSGDVVVVHAGPARLMHPSLSEFSTPVTGEIAKGSRKIVINLGGVEYLDSAAIGCLMDLYRQATAAGRDTEARRRAAPGRDDADADGREPVHGDPPRRRCGREELLRGRSCAA